MAGAGVLDVLGQHALEHLVQALHVGIVEVARAAARLEQEEGVAVERRRVEVVGELLGHLANRLGVGLFLIHALLGIEVLHVAHLHRLDEGLLPRRGGLAQRQRLLQSGVGKRRVLGQHRAVQVRTPRPGFPPVADGARRIALPRFAERAHRVELGERVHHLEALVEELLGFVVGRGDRAGEGPEAHRVERDRIGDVLGEFQRGRPAGLGRRRGRAHRHVVLGQCRYHRRHPRRAHCEHGDSNTTTRTPHGILPESAMRGPSGDHSGNACRWCWACV